MEKQKKIYFICLLALSLLAITDVVLFVCKVIKVIPFVIFFVVFLSLISLFVYLFIKCLKKIKEIKTKQEQSVSSGNYMEDLYNVLGIPVQYNEDGSIKDIYDLLGIEPIYDENGNRILTIYELLQIMPKFDNNGREIPSVTVIKNRVNRIAKVDVSSRVLTRKLTEEEKELIAIREALTKKLKEAEVLGDVKKQEAIKEVLKNQSKNKGKKEEDSKPINYIFGKGVAPEKTKKVEALKFKAPVNVKINEYFSTFRNGNKVNPKDKNKNDSEKKGEKNTKVEEPKKDNNKIDKEDSDDASKRKCYYVEIEEERNL